MNDVDTGRPFVVLDEFLDNRDHARIWDMFQTLDFRLVHGQRWIKAFRISDGMPLWADVFVSAPAPADRTSRTIAYPTGLPIDGLIAKMLGDQTIAETLGQANVDWDYFFCRPYVYPQGAGLSWHTDGRSDVVGAFVYYAHLEWQPSWGAELLIDGSGMRRKAEPERRDEDAETQSFHLDWRRIDEAVMQYGCGHYVMAKPNRMVLLQPGVLHRINPVSPLAGDRIRCSFTGFFVKEP